MPPSEMTGTSASRTASATLATAEICGTPTPATTRVVQIEPGPMPTFTASAPAATKARAASGVAILPAMTCWSDHLALMRSTQGASSTGAMVPFVTQQPNNEWLARVFIGQAVHNAAGETIGDINDLVFNRKGQISTVVIGVGGFLSIGEKGVGVPFSTLTFNVGKNGERIIVVALSKQDLVQAVRAWLGLRV